MSASDPTFTRADVLRLRGGHVETVQDVLAVEEPLEIRLGYTDPRKGRTHRSVSITMRTPGDDSSLALGFLFSESILRSRADVTSIDTSNPNVIRIELDAATTFDPLRLERMFYTTSSCGVCGKASLEALSMAGFDALRDEDFTIGADLLQQLPDKLRAGQKLFEQTGGNHAVGLFNSDGEIVRIAEDVGRHNAMDKLVGALLQDDSLPLRDHGILLSGRASFELVQKALAAGCQVLVAVGAPSSLAVELAQEFNMTLAGFLGENGFNIYHGAVRIRL
ncbi:MAG: formate dehydrogenase accessory sulfurtransferase FdhD [Pseudomonadota bacterium]|nr:formate dehydrogenase accessory sulfurtransferase FdhD [Pseudomonadota bacterium]